MSMRPIDLDALARVEWREDLTAELRTARRRLTERIARLSDIPPADAAPLADALLAFALDTAARIQPPLPATDALIVARRAVQETLRIPDPGLVHLVNGLVCADRGLARPLLHGRLARANTVPPAAVAPLADALVALARDQDDLRPLAHLSADAVAVLADALGRAHHALSERVARVSAVRPADAAPLADILIVVALDDAAHAQSPAPSTRHKDLPGEVIIVVQAVRRIQDMLVRLSNDDLVDTLLAALGQVLILL